MTRLHVAARGAKWIIPGKSGSHEVVGRPNPRQELKESCRYKIDGVTPLIHAPVDCDPL